MKKTLFALLALLSITLSSCFFGVRDYKKANDALEGFKRRSAEMRYVPSEEREQRIALKNAIVTGITHDERESLDKIRRYLEEGYDPNKSEGEAWPDKTPLHLVVKSFCDSWARIKLGMEVSDPPSDIVVFWLLVDAGADVNQWPYIWYRVYRYKNSGLDQKIRNERRDSTGKPLTNEETERRQEQAIFYYVNDANRVIEAFLKAGADPDKLGHPYPFSYEAKVKWISDEEASECFAKGTRPLYEAIKKGIRWESQVDLLLQYTTLDEDSLEAARESNDPAMIEKITRLWGEQNAGR